MLRFECYLLYAVSVRYGDILLQLLNRGIFQIDRYAVYQVTTGVSCRATSQVSNVALGKRRSKD